MGRIDLTDDFTGDLSPTELNAQDIENIIAELNRNSNQLDAVQNNLAIVTRGKTSLTTPAGVGDLFVDVNHGLGFPPAVMAFYTLSSDPNTVYQLPSFVLDGSGNFLYSVLFTSTNNNLRFEVNGTLPAITFNFSYYLLKQPANLTSISL